MAKAFSVASWNVEYFGAKNKGNDKPKKPIGPIIDFLAGQGADVVAVYEVVGKIVFEEIVTKMPGYQFHITEGPQSQEILVGVKKSLTSFFTQKTGFKSGAAMLRPGALLTLRIGSENYPLLFLHLKSLSVPKGFGLRDDMTERAIDFRKTLNKADANMGGDRTGQFPVSRRPEYDGHEPDLQQKGYIRCRGNRPPQEATGTQQGLNENTRQNARRDILAGLRLKILAQ